MASTSDGGGGQSSLLFEWDLRERAKQRLAALDIVDRGIAHGNLKNMRERQLYVSTCCSGSDGIINVKEAAIGGMMDYFNWEVGTDDVGDFMRHRFSCEKEDWLASCILQNHKPDFMYKDLMDLRKLVATDTITNKSSMVPSDVRWSSCGWTC